MKKHHVEIKNPPKPWWPGDSRVEKYMKEVSNAIDRHISGDARVDIYNRAYEAVYKAIKDYSSELSAEIPSEEITKSIESHVKRERVEELNAIWLSTKK